ncbi:MAG: hypothetical protein ACK56I_36115, partial [bacterium]
LRLSVRGNAQKVLSHGSMAAIFFLTRVFPNGAFLNNFGGLHFGISSSFFLTYSLMSGNLQMSISPRG